MHPSGVFTALAAAKNQRELRRRLQELHSDARNRGLSPIEALQTVARELEETYEPSGSLFDDVTGAARAELLAVTFQQFISDDARSVFGQYLTPVVVAEYLAKLIQEEDSDGVVMDPFMGSGILLDAVLRVNPRMTGVGVEINESVAQIGRTSLRLASHTTETIVDDAFSAWLRGRLPRANSIAMNPPFGTQATVANASELRATRTSAWLGNPAVMPVELLALELCMDTVTVGGKVAAILPQSVLTNGKWANFRKYFFSEYALTHVTTLPETTFAPFRGVARACILIIENRRPESLVSPFNYLESKSVGYDDTGRPHGVSDLESLLAAKPSLSQSAHLDVNGNLVRLRTRPLGEVSYRLGDIAEVFRGRNPKRDEFVESGPFLLKVGSLSGSFISWRDRKRSRVPQEWFDKLGALHLRDGDICMTATAHRPSYIGLKVDLVSNPPPLGAIASAEVLTIRLRPNAPIAPEALLYYLRSNDGYSQLQSLVRGSTAHIYPKDVQELAIPDPNGLFNVEDLIELHKRAEESFRKYIAIEDEIELKVGLPSVAEDRSWPEAE